MFVVCLLYLTFVAHLSCWLFSLYVGTGYLVTMSLFLWIFLLFLFFALLIFVVMYVSFSSFSCVLFRIFASDSTLLLHFL